VLEQLSLEQKKSVRWLRLVLDQKLDTFFEATSCRTKKLQGYQLFIFFQSRYHISCYYSVSFKYKNQRIKKHVLLYGKTHLSYTFHIKNTVFGSLVKISDWVRWKDIIIKKIRIKKPTTIFFNIFFCSDDLKWNCSKISLWGRPLSTGR
jgi:hypothetical protein